MRIAINTRLLLRNQLEGMGWFTYEIAKRLVAQHPEHEFFFLFDRKYDTRFIFGKNVKALIVPPMARIRFCFTYGLNGRYLLFLPSIKLMFFFHLIIFAPCALKYLRYW